MRSLCFSRTSKSRQCPLVFTMIDKRSQPLHSGFFFFGGDDPPDGSSLIPGSLITKKCPRNLVCAKLFLISCGKLGGLSLLVGIYFRALFLTFLKSRKAGGVHQPQCGKLGGAFNVDRAPGAARFPRRKSNLIANGVHTLAEAIDPTKTECAIHRLRPGDAGPTGIPLEEADPQFLGLGVMLFKPCAPGRWRWKEIGLRWHRDKFRIIFYISQSASTSTISWVRGIFC